MKNRLMIVAVTGIVAGSTWMSSSCSQTTKAEAPAATPSTVQLPAVAQPPAEAPAVAQSNAEPPAVSPSPYYYSRVPRSDAAVFGMYYGAGRDSEIGAIVQQLRATEDEATKAELAKKLEKAVGESFDQDMKNREAELTKLEARLTKLRAQLERRRKAKDEITQLQVKVLVNEAEGLGFSDAVPPGPANKAPAAGSWASPSRLEGEPRPAQPFPASKPAATPGRSVEQK